MKCPACGTMAFMEVDKDFLRCHVCGLGFMPEARRQARILELHKAGYSDAEAYSPIEDADHKARVTHQVLKAWNAFHGRGDVVEGKGTILEVGFGNGAMLDEFRRLGWAESGIDQSSKAVEGAAGRGHLRVIQGQFDEPDNGGADFYEWGMQGNGAVCRGAFNTLDIVVAWDSFEHLYHLPMAFRIASKLLKPGGLLAMHSPNFDAFRGDLKHPHFGDRSHLWHMTIRSATLLAQAVGLVAAKVEASACWGDPGYCHPDNLILWGRKP